jgi:hypothetical protein
LKKLCSLVICLFLIISIVVLSGCGGGKNSGRDGTTYNLTINISPVEGGSVSPSSGKYVSGSRVNITTLANRGYVFDKWDSNLAYDNDKKAWLLIMDSDKMLTATFKHISYTIAITTTGTGSGTVSQELISSDESGDTIRFTANSSSHSKFVGWSGGISGTDNPKTITINSDISVTAEFIKASSDYMGFEVGNTWTYQEHLYLSNPGPDEQQDSNETYTVGILSKNDQNIFTIGEVGSAYYDYDKVEGSSYYYYGEHEDGRDYWESTPYPLILDSITLESSQDFFGNHLRQELVTVPAGTFLAEVFESLSSGDDGSTEDFVNWIVPYIGQVKCIDTYRNNTGGVEIDTSELTAYDFSGIQNSSLWSKSLINNQKNKGSKSRRYLFYRKKKS